MTACGTLYPRILYSSRTQPASSSVTRSGTSFRAAVFSGTTFHVLKSSESIPMGSGGIQRMTGFLKGNAAL